MEFILIGKTKLKVSLTASELAAFDTNAEELDYTKPKTKAMLREVLTRAETELGFTCNGGRTLFQVYTSKNGDCEIFVTLTETEDDEGTIHCRSVYDRSHEPLCRSVFGFNNVEWLLTVCKRLCDVGYSGKSSAYIGEDRRFYLFLDGLYSPEYSAVDEYTFICEYGEQENASAMAQYLAEHGKEICNARAVETLSVL